MRAQLAPLREELRIWRDLGLVLPLWWRDDDAIEPTPALNRLIRLADNFGAPLHLAVIPEPARPDLAARLASTSRVFVLQHGWSHRNHAPATEKKAEFGPHRPLAPMLEEIEHGWQRLRELFETRTLPVFTPPWNRIALPLALALPDLGLAALSTYLPRPGKQAAPGLLQVNTHVDPIDWRGERRLLDPDSIAGGTAALLSARRKGTVSNEEPFGLLTHHLVHDEPIWSFTSAFMETLLEGGAVFVSPLAELEQEKTPT